MKRLLITFLLAAGSFAFAADNDVGRARELLDTYYGNRANLNAARDHLERAVAAQPASSDVYVQAARLAAMSGHVIGNQVRGNTLEVYHALLDKALALDAANAKAYILKAEAYHLQGRLDAEKQSLDKARELGTRDPWLWNGYARHHEQKGEEREASAALQRVIAGGVGKTASEQKAYVSALNKAAVMQHTYRKPGDLMDYAAPARRHRHPSDAWVMGNMAGLFNLYGRYDDAIDFARDALRTMDYGMARTALSTALYGRAAQLVLAKQQAKADALIAEAASLGSDADRIWAGFPPAGAEIAKLRPILEKIVPGTEPPAAPAMPVPHKFRHGLKPPQGTS